MKNQIKKGTHVILKTFLGIGKATKDVGENENYWILIGQKGLVVEERDRKVLVLFDKDLDVYHLENHNPLKNSLWINRSDLELDIDKLEQSN